jgi:hypothetical protein
MIIKQVIPILEKLATAKKPLSAGSPECEYNISPVLYDLFNRCTILDLPGTHKVDIEHDLSYPIDSKWHGQFDLVIDPGTIEHTANPTQCLINYMHLVCVNGTLQITTTTDSNQQHGYFQFNPQWFSNFLSLNGFSLELYTHTLSRFGKLTPFTDVGIVPYTLHLPRLVTVVAQKIFETKKITYPVQQFWTDKGETEMKPYNHNLIRDIWYLLRYFVTHLR